MNKRTGLLITVLFIILLYPASECYGYHLLRIKFGVKYLFGFTSALMSGEFYEYRDPDYNLDRFDCALSSFVQPQWGHGGGIYLYATHLSKERERDKDLFSFGFVAELVVQERKYTKEWFGRLVKLDQQDQFYTGYEKIDFVFIGMPIMLRITYPFNIITHIGFGFQALIISRMQGHSLEMHSFSEGTFWVRETPITNENVGDYVAAMNMDFHLGLGYMLDFEDFYDPLETFRSIIEIRFFINVMNNDKYYFGFTHDWGLQLHVNLEYFDLEI